MVHNYNPEQTIGTTKLHRRKCRHCGRLCNVWSVGSGLCGQCLYDMKSDKITLLNEKWDKPEKKYKVLKVRG